jgi:hypothetical protein
LDRSDLQSELFFLIDCLSGQFLPRDLFVPDIPPYAFAIPMADAFLVALSATRKVKSKISADVESG